MSDSGAFPLACSICRKPCSVPVVTNCNHYFCNACAVKESQENNNCFVCNKPTLGLFYTAVEKDYVVPWLDHTNSNCRRIIECSRVSTSHGMGSTNQGMIVPLREDLSHQAPEDGLGGLGHGSEHSQITVSKQQEEEPLDDETLLSRFRTEVAALGKKKEEAETKEEEAETKEVIYLGRFVKAKGTVEPVAKVTMEPVAKVTVEPVSKVTVEPVAKVTVKPPSTSKIIVKKKAVTVTVTAPVQLVAYSDSDDDD